MHSKSTGWVRLASVLLAGCCATAAVAAPPATRPAATPEQMLAWWQDLEKTDPLASRALLNFADHPDQAVAFLKPRLKPLKIDAEELQPLIAALGSDEPPIAKAAFEQLEYFDPRLTMDLEALMKEVTDPTTRTRLVALLCDGAMDAYKGKKIQLRPVGKKGEGYNFFDGNGSWWAEHKVERLGEGGWSGGKTKWTRAIRAIALLQHIGTPDALAIIKDMSTGHPDAGPTKVAKEVLVTAGATK